jgi:hypothetical protein
MLWSSVSFGKLCTSATLRSCDEGEVRDPSVGRFGGALGAANRSMSAEPVPQMPCFTNCTLGKSEAAHRALLGSRRATFPLNLQVRVRSNGRGPAPTDSRDQAQRL